MFTEDDLFCLSCKVQLPEIQKVEDIRVALKGKTGLDEVDVMAWLYFYKDSKTQELMHQIKYYNKSNLAVALGKKLANKFSENIESGDILVPVPLHPRRLHERGYNQSQKIAEGIESITGARIENGLLKRVLYHRSQTFKTKEEREEVMFKTYMAKNGNLRLDPVKKVILIDDVITTGSTISGCLRILEDIIPNRISVVTLAIAI